MTRRELRLQKKIAAAIRAAGGMARIVAQTGMTTVGDGDLYGCLHGKMLVWEVKDGDAYHPTLIQKFRLRQWRKAGADARVVRSLAEAEEHIRALQSHR